ncbi:hypothetical protein SNE40_007484 [Patella caerulea]|uniref:Uncharacterized protein n=1 Tax=Patella caerulea TaxID=87958 RepID=A0AAN8JXT1_PATCE
MPVKIENGGENSSQSIPKEIECLVNEVRERLCLKSQEKLSKCYRSTPYSLTSPCRSVGNISKGTCVKCSFGVKRPVLKRRDRLCTCEDKSQQQQENPRNLLEQLLREQTLIQEAVRRLHSRKIMEVVNCEKSQLCESSPSSSKPSSSISNSACSYETGSPIIAS